MKLKTRNTVAVAFLFTVFCLSSKAIAADPPGNAVGQNANGDYIDANGNVIDPSGNPVSPAGETNGASNGTPTPGGTGATGGETASIDDDKNFSSAMGGSRVTEILNVPDANNLIESYEGWTEDYSGYEKSPILLASRDGKRERKFVWLAQDKDNTDVKQLSIENINLNVTKEVKKSALGVFTSTWKMKDEYKNSSAQQQNQEKNATSMVGVVTTTAGFMDKTIAASMSTVGAGAQAETTNILLKQINWNMYRATHPDLDHIFDDQDEKIQACISSNASTSNSSTRIKMDMSKCASNCGQPQGQLLAFCLCCSEITTTSNGTVDSGGLTGENYPEGSWSLVQRIFYGTKGPEAGGGGGGGGSSSQANPGEQAKFYTLVMKSFIELYGDIVYTQGENSNASESNGTNNTNGTGATAGTAGTTPAMGGTTPGATTNSGSTGGGGSSSGFDGFKYVLPKLTPAMKIDIMKRGIDSPYYNAPGAQCNDTGAPASTDRQSACEFASQASGGTLACPITGQMVRFGVYPALTAIMKAWPPRQGDEQELKCMRELWEDASLGVVLDADKIMGLFIAGGVSFPLKRDWTPQGRLQRWLDAYSDASAITAFKRYHYRMMSIMKDLLVMNLKATDNDKRLVQNLMQRVTDYLNLAEMDVNAKLQSESMVLGLSREVARIRESQMSAASAAQISARDNTAMASQMFNLGYASRHCVVDVNGNCLVESGGTTATPTVR